MVSKITGYAASLYAVTLSCSVISFATTMVVAHRIPKGAFGEYGLFVTVTAVLGMLLASGLGQSLVKNIGENPAAKKDFVALILVSFASIALVAWPLATVLLVSVGGIWVVSLAVLPFFVLAILSAAMFRAGFEKARELALQASISLLASGLTLAFTFLSANPSVAPIRGGALSFTIPGLVLLIALVRISGHRSVGGLWRAATSAPSRQVLAFAIPLAIAGAAVVAYSHASVVLVRGIVGLEALGEYYFALQLMLLLEKPLEIFAAVTLAAFSREPAITPERHRYFVGFNLAVFPMIAASVAWCAPVLVAIVDFLLGSSHGSTLAEKYPNAPAFLALLTLAVPLRSVEFLVSTLAIARGRPEANRNTHVLTTLVSLPTLVALISWIGPWGAALMPLFYQSVFLSLQAFQLRKEMPEIVRTTIVSAALATVLLALVLLAGRVTTSVAIFPVVSAAYLAAGHLLRLWDLRQIVGGKKTEGARIPLAH